MSSLSSCALLLWLLAPAGGATVAEPVPVVVALPTDGFEEDRAAFEDALIDWEDLLDETEDRKEKRRLRKEHPAGSFADRMRAHAAAGEARAAEWLLEYLTKLGLRRSEREELRLELYDLLLQVKGPADLRTRTLERIFSDGALKRAVGLDGLERIVERFVEGESDPDQRGRAWLRLAGKLGSSKDETNVGRAVELLKRLLGGGPEGSDTGTTTLSGKDRKDAELLLFRLEHLRVGGIAPDFTGKTVDGEVVSLADFSGRVTVLDFFGFW